MARIVVSILFSLLVAVIGHGQHRVQGTVSDRIKSAVLEGATVQAFSLSDSTKASGASNKGGAFSLSGMKPGKYRIITTLLGYLPDTLNLQVTNRDMQISISLTPAVIAIDEVEVLLKNPVVLKGDTMEFDASNYSTREYADADELIAQIPGVEIDEEGNVVAQGENVQRIIVDGKEFFSTDPRVALKNLPADIIDKIQIIDEKSEQARFSGFDDGQRRKVINIVTKPDRRVGYFGRAMAGKGDGDKFNTAVAINRFNGSRRYSLNVMANNVNEVNAMESGRGRFRGSSGGGNTNTERGISDTYNGSLSFNDSYLNQKMDVSADYSFRWNDTETNTTAQTEYLIASRSNQFQDQIQFSDNRNNAHSINARMRWEVDSANRLDFSPNLSYTGANRLGTNFARTSLEQTTPINQTDRSNTAENSNFSFGGDLTYMHRFKSPGRTISANINGNRNSNDALALNLATTEYYQEALLDRIDTNNNQSATNAYGSGFRSRLSLTERVGRYSRLQANYNFRNTSSYSNRETFEFLAETGQLGELRDRLSNEFRNDFNFHSGGLSFSYNKRDTLQIQIELNYQHGVRVNNRTVPIHLVTEANFGSWLPAMTIVRRFSRSKSLEFNYSTATNTPSINQLQDFINNQNELRITNGNPNLNQEYRHTLRLQYRNVDRNTGKSLNTNVNFEYINDRIVNSVLTTDRVIELFEDVILGAGGQYTVPINMDGSYNFRATNSVGFPLSKWKLNTNFNTNLFFNNNLGVVNDVRIPSHTYGFQQRIGINTNFNPKYVVGISYQLSGRYTENRTNPVPRFSVYTQRLSTTANVEFLKNFVFNTSMTYLYNGGINGSEAIEITMLNASLGYKMLKKRNGEITLRGFDLLNNAQNVNRTIDEISARNVTSNTLNRYFLLSFTYNLRQFSGSSGGGERGERGRGRSSGSGMRERGDWR